MYAEPFLCVSTLDSNCPLYYTCATTTTTITAPDQKWKMKVNVRLDYRIFDVQDREKNNGNGQQQCDNSNDRTIGINELLNFIIGVANHRV